MGPKSAKSVKYPGSLRVYLENPGYAGMLPVSSILPQISPQTSSQIQGNSRVSRMEHQTWSQTPSVFPGNFRKRTQSAGDPLFSFLFAGKVYTGQPPTPRTSHPLAPLFNCTTSGGGRGPPEAPCAAQQCGNGAPGPLVSTSTDFPIKLG